MADGGGRGDCRHHHRAQCEAVVGYRGGVRDGNVSRLKITVKGPTYFSQGDENAFFNWLRTIKCVEGVGGEGWDLHITLARPPGNADLRELIALFFRFGVNMRSLAAFHTVRNANWFAENRKAFWHSRVFGKTKS